MKTNCMVQGHCWRWQAAAFLRMVFAFRNGSVTLGPLGVLQKLPPVRVHLAPHFRARSYRRPLLSHNEACEGGMRKGGAQTAFAFPLAVRSSKSPLCATPLPLVRQPITNSDTYTVPATLTDCWPIFPYHSATSIHVWWIHCIHIV